MDKKWDDYEKAVDKPFGDLKGKTLISINGIEGNSEQITFMTSLDEKYTLTYYDDCCASCSVEDICGDVSDLIGSEIILAEEISSSEIEGDLLATRKAEYEAAKVKFKPRFSDDEFYYYGPSPDNDWKEESETWSFYKLATIKGSVTIRWYGSSNGYYSETATFEKWKSA